MNKISKLLFLLAIAGIQTVGADNPKPNPKATPVQQGAQISEADIMKMLMEAAARSGGGIPGLENAGNEEEVGADGNGLADADIMSLLGQLSGSGQGQVNAPPTVSKANQIGISIAVSIVAAALFAGGTWNLKHQDGNRAFVNLLSNQWSANIIHWLGIAALSAATGGATFGILKLVNKLKQEKKNELLKQRNNLLKNALINGKVSDGKILARAKILGLPHSIGLAKGLLEQLMNEQLKLTNIPAEMAADRVAIEAELAVLNKKIKLLERRIKALQENKA